MDWIREFVGTIRNIEHVTSGTDPSEKSEIKTRKIIQNTPNNKRNRN